MLHRAALMLAGFPLLSLAAAPPEFLVLART
jgi:hypothetical protein